MDSAREVRWAGDGDRRSFLDPANWSGGSIPGSGDRACFTSDAPDVIEFTSEISPIEVGRLEVDLAGRHHSLRFIGAGTLRLTGADRLAGKPVSLQVASGTLDIGDGISIQIAAPRFSAHPGGTLIVGSGDIRAVVPDLKIAVSHSGCIRVTAKQWDPGMHLDLATSRSRGLGSHTIDMASDRRPQFLYFESFKEHDADPVAIRGFQDGDAIVFRKNPYDSTDPGKDLVIEQIRFEGWPGKGRAEIRHVDGFWLLLPANSMSPPKLPSRQKPRRSDKPIQERAIASISEHMVIAPSTEEFPRNDGGDIALLDDSKIFAVWKRIDKNRSATIGARIIDAHSGTDAEDGLVSPGIGEQQSAPETLRSVTDVGIEDPGFPSLVQMEDGSVLVVFDAQDTAGVRRIVTAILRPGESDDTWYLISPVALLGTEGCSCANSRIHRTPGGRLFLPVARKLDGGQTEVGCFYSEDRGESFLPSVTWLSATGALSFPSVVSLGSRLAMFAATPLHRIYRSFSEDDGVSWEPATEVTRLISPMAPAAFDSYKDSVLALWNRNSRGAIGQSGRANEVEVGKTRGGDRINLTIAASEDDGTDWSVVGTVENEPGETYSYPAIHSAQGRMLISYNVGKRLSSDGALATSLVVKEITLTR